jgi:hypothetical protein
MLRFVTALSAAFLLLTCSRADADGMFVPVDQGPLRTDANLVTAIDVSGSIDRFAESLELAGMADALVHPAVVHAIESGYHRRIGFSVFTWSSGGGFVELVPWTLIGSKHDAQEVATRLRAAREVEPSPSTTPWSLPARRPWRSGMATDISAAIDHGRDLVAEAPFPTSRSIINVCVNGRDNVGDGPEAARDRAVAEDVVINGVVLGVRDGLASYFRERVQAGAGSFVIEARQQPDLTNAMLRKFVTEIAWRPPERGGT